MYTEPLLIPFQKYDAIHHPLKDQMLATLSEVISGGIYLFGERTTAFESAYAAYCGTRHAVGVGSGLDALVLSLKALGIGPGDEVIIPANTYIATVMAVSHVGAIPVLVEPLEHTFNMDPTRCKAAITERTRAIVPVHLFGLPCEIPSFMQMAEEHGLYVIEDNAQAHGAAYGGKRTGGWGHLNATSFHPGKNLGALGDGGAVTTNDEELAVNVRMWGNYGSSEKYFNRVQGFNSRLDEIQAAILGLKLERLDSWNAERRSIARTYTDGLSATGDLWLPTEIQHTLHVYHRYVIRTQQRDALRAYLAQKGIGTMIHYPVPPHLQQAYGSQWRRGMFPITERMADTSLSLPVYPGLSSEEIQLVIHSIHEFFN